MPAEKCVDVPDGRRLADRFGHVEGEEVAGGKKQVDGGEIDVIGVDVPRLPPAEFADGGLGGGRACWPARSR